MESMEREVEGSVPICFRASNNIEKPLPRGKSPFSFLVFPYIDSFNSYRPFSGIFIFAFIEDEVHRLQNLSFFSDHFGCFWYCRINRDDIARLQKIYSEAKRVGQSTDRRYLPGSSLSYLPDWIFIDWDSEPNLSIPLVSLGTHGFTHGTDTNEICLGTKELRDFLFFSLVGPCLPFFNLSMVYPLLKAPPSFFVSSQYILQKSRAQRGLILY